MKQLTKAAIRRPVTVLVTLVALVLFSLVSISNMSLQLMPNISVPVMVVVGTYPGASPEEVDENVIEVLREACANISGLKKARSRSYENYGMLVLQFDYGTVISDAHDDIRSNIDTILNDLPDEVGTPTIMEIDTDAIDDMTLSVSTDAPEIDLLNLVNEKLEPRLRRAAALADISVTGGDEHYIAVRILPEYADQYGINASGVAAAISSVNFSMPAGSVAYGDQSLNMETEVRYDDLETLRQVPITTARGQVIHLYDVCDISYGISDKTSLSRYNGENDISIGLKRKQSATSVTLSNEVKKLIAEFVEENPEIHIEIVNDSADEIVSTLLSVFKTLIEGIILAMVVIFIFFGDIKGSLIVGSTMPVSILFALVCIYFAGISLNVVSMASLVIAIGMITDNAVVVIEMCFHKQEDGMDFSTAAYEGTAIVVNSVVGSTITTVVVYLPLALLQGLSGQFFKQLGFTIVFVLLASLFCAVTLVPFFFSAYKPTERKNNPVTIAIQKVAGVYGKFLEKILNKSALVALVAILTFGLSVFLAGGLGTELIGATDEGVIQMDVKFRPDLSLESMDETIVRLEQFVENSGLAKSYNISLSEGTSSATVTAYKAEEVTRTTQDIVDEWNGLLRDFSTICEITVSSGSTTGLGSMNTGGSEEFDIAADDMVSLREASKSITAILESTPGVLSVSSTVEDSGAKVLIDIDPEMAQAKGLSPSVVSQLIYMNRNGTEAGDVTIDHTKYAIKVEYPKGYYTTLDDVASMSFMNSSGTKILLSEIADLRLVQAAQTVTRADGRYDAAITAVMTAETKDGILEGVNERLAALQLPEGVNFIENSITETMNEEFAAIGQAIVIAFYLVFMVMAIQFESLAYSILIMLCIPFAAIGSILMMLIMQVKVSMTVLLGILMLAGIVVNNGIIYIDTTNQFREAGEEIQEALVHAGKDRLRPILITTLTTELAMLPIAFKLAKNTESMQGMAVVIVGGLLASTILTLLLLPNFYLIFQRFRRKKDPVKADG